MEDEFVSTILMSNAVAFCVAAVTANMPFRLFMLWSLTQPLLRQSLWWFAVVNNAYQVVSHVVTAAKFVGKRVPFTPGGADEVQSMLAFNVYNQIDLWGWWAYFMYFGNAPLLMNVLAAVHSGMAAISVMYPMTFQYRYIVPGGSALFRVSKAGFVTIDAITRMLAVYWLLCG